MSRLLQGILVLTLAGTVGATQIRPAITPQQAAEADNSSPSQLDRAELLQRIERYDAAARNAETARPDHNRLAKLYTDLGNLYAAAGLYLKAEDAMKHAITNLKDGSQPDLADEFDQLAVVHAELKNFKQAERDELESLRIRGSVGDPVGSAFTWRDLAGIYGLQRKFDKAADYAQRAYDVLGNRSDVSVDDRIAVRQTLGYSLTSVRKCGEGIPILRDALDLAKHSFGDPGLQAGYARYLLGLGYWHCGDRDDAAKLLASGTAEMKADFGWDHTIYLNAMRQYARFLRWNGQVEAAADAEAVVNQAGATVDAQSLTGMAEGFRKSGAK